MIPKTELIPNTWYIGNSSMTKIAMWEADKQMFIFGYQYPGSEPDYNRLFYVDGDPLAFEPLSILSPQLPQSWTPAQCIRISNILKTQAEQDN